LKSGELILESRLTID